MLNPLIIMGISTAEFILVKEEPSVPWAPQERLPSFLQGMNSSSPSLSSRELTLLTPACSSQPSPKLKLVL